MEKFLPEIIPEWLNQEQTHILTPGVWSVRHCSWGWGNEDTQEAHQQSLPEGHRQEETLSYRCCKLYREPKDLLCWTVAHWAPTLWWCSCPGHPCSCQWLMSAWFAKANWDTRFFLDCCFVPSQGNLFFLLKESISVQVFHLYVYLCTLSSWCPWLLEKDIKSPGLQNMWATIWVGVIKLSFSGRSTNQCSKVLRCLHLELHSFKFEKLLIYSEFRKSTCIHTHTLIYITRQRVWYLVACLLVMVKLNGGLGIASLMDLPTIDDRSDLMMTTLLRFENSKNYVGLPSTRETIQDHPSTTLSVEASYMRPCLNIKSKQISI